jgi:hypothetical protein
VSPWQIPIIRFLDSLVAQKQTEVVTSLVRAAETGPATGSRWMEWAKGVTRLHTGGRKVEAKARRTGGQVTGWSDHKFLGVMLSDNRQRCGTHTWKCSGGDRRGRSIAGCRRGHRKGNTRHLRCKPGDMGASWKPRQSKVLGFQVGGMLSRNFFLGEVPSAKTCRCGTLTIQARGRGKDEDRELE